MLVDHTLGTRVCLTKMEKVTLELKIEKIKLKSSCKNSKGPKIFRWLEFFEPFGNGYILIINYE
jgi:hypothetical protein